MLHKFLSYRDYNWFWVPLVGPMLGSLLAYIVYASLIKYHWPDEELHDKPCTSNGKHNPHINEGFSSGK